MWKLLASVLSVAAIGGPVTVALAAEDDTPTDAQGEPLAAEPASVPLELRASSERSEERESRREARRVDRETAVPAALEAIASCESGGDLSAVGGSGTYRGKYQFSRETWASVGGSGDPAEASEREQDRRATTLYEREGPGHWPVCGQ
jgi:Transglycosylase-like domain